jgi:hypothetical protein
MGKKVPKFLEITHLEGSEDPWLFLLDLRSDNDLALVSDIERGS